MLAGVAAIGCQQATNRAAEGTASTSQISTATSPKAEHTRQPARSNAPTAFPHRKPAARSSAPRVPGNLKPVPARKIRTLPKIPITAPAAFGGGVFARVVHTSAIRVSAHGPGDVGGNAVAVTLAITNKSGAVILLNSVSVNAVYAATVPASPFETKPAAPIHGSLASGATRSGVYVFMIPSAHRHDVTILVSYSPGHPIAVLEGAAG